MTLLADLLRVSSSPLPWRTTVAWGEDMQPMAGICGRIPASLSVNVYLISTVRDAPVSEKLAVRADGLITKLNLRAPGL